MKYKLSIKTTRSNKIFDPYESWEAIMERHGILRFTTHMNHWESWMDIEFKSQAYCNMFKIAYSEHL